MNFFKEKKLFFLGLLIAVIATILDLYSKSFIFNFLIESGTSQLEITSFFNLVMVWNNGVSFGMFNEISYGKYIILTVNITILLVLFAWIYRNNSKYLNIALSLIIGGAMGNIIDRISNGAVADFLDFYVGTYHWPAFNVADSCVFIGVAMLLLEDFFIKKNCSKNER